MRYFVVLGVQLRASLQVAMQYRADFALGGLMALFWVGWNLVPLAVVFNRRPSVAGWTVPEALLVIAWFTLLRGLFEGAVQPSLLAVVEHIRQGTLDFVLVKPADAQFLISTSKVEVWRTLDAVGAFGLGGYAFHMMHRTPAVKDLAAALVLTIAAAAVLYSLAIVVVSAAFFVVRLDNLIYLFNAIFDAARWPVTVFRGFWRILFTFVIPLALMTTYPALAVLGRLEGSTAVFALFGAVLFALLARATFRSAIGKYTSASS